MTQERLHDAQLCLQCIDLTSLNTTDSQQSIAKWIQKINGIQVDFPQLPYFAAICVYPNFIRVVRDTMQLEGVKIAATTACFPASQSFLEVKCKETEMAVQAGADEVDVVISVGEFLSGNESLVLSELKALKQAAGKAHCKVILETGALPSVTAIKEASFLAMEAGADMIKTSTGKIAISATPEAGRAMAEAIKEFQQKTNRVVGLKIAGGVSTTEQALVYHDIVKDVLGQAWLNNDRFRIGASRLFNDLLSNLEGKTINYI